MCKQATQTDHPNHETQEPDMLETCLIPKTPTQTTANKVVSTTKQPKKATTQFTLILQESISISRIAIPMILTGLLLYSRSVISMFFLGHLGDLALAGGSLAIGFANITGYSILSGLAMGMEPICGQAFGAKRYNLIALTLQRTILLLLFTSIPISFLWINMKAILIFFRQDQLIASEAQTYLLYSTPDLLAQAFLHPLRIYLRTQSITLPLTFCAGIAILLHVPTNYFLVIKLNLGVRGVALSSVWTNFNLVSFLIAYIIFSKAFQKTWCAVSKECLKGWKNLLTLAIPSCVSVCLEWWWYEIMIVLCGLLANPKTTVASMGILIQTTSLIYIFPSSLSFSVSTRVGNEMGARMPVKAKWAAIVGLSSSFVLGSMALFFAVSVRHVWASMFTQDRDITKMTSLVLPVIGLCELGNCPQTTGCGVLRGTARPKVGANINLGCFYLVGMPVALCLAFYYEMGFAGLWFGLLAAQFACMVTMMVVLMMTDWEFEARRAHELTNSGGGGGGYETLKDADRLCDENDEDVQIGNKGNICMC